MPKSKKQESDKSMVLLGELKIEAAAPGEGEQPKPASVHIAAYNGGLIRVNEFGAVVVDLEGLESNERVPLLADHENRLEAILGSGQPRVADGRLEISGTLSRTSELAKRAIQLYSDGVPLQASIGAVPLETERIQRGKQVVVNGRTIRASEPFTLVRRSRLVHVALVANGADWTTNVSIAAIAADSKKELEMSEEFINWLKAKGFDAETLSAEQAESLKSLFESQKPEKQVAASVEAIRAEIAAETERINAIRKVCAGKHAEIEAKAIREGWDVSKAELEVLRADRPRGPAIHVREWNDSAEVMEAALCMARRHKDVEEHFKEEVLEAAERQYRGRMGFQQLFMTAAIANGYNALPGERITASNINEVLHYAMPPRMVQAAASTLSLPGILSNVANKELLQGYMEEDQTWREIAAIKSVSDFKTVTSYRLLDDLQYEELPKHGEIKHGSVSEESYTRQARTYAKMFTLDRQDIINDDLGAFDDLRTRIGAGAARKFNNVFWATFMNNSSFFTAARGNYIVGAGTALGLDGTGLQEGVTAFRKLRTPSVDGKKRLVGGRPEILLVPPELEFIAQRLFQSTLVTGGSSAMPDANIHAGKYRPVVSNWLSDSEFTGNSTTAWYLFRAPNSLAPVVVSFLNGQQTPTVDVAEADFNRLGVQFRGYHDFGVDLAEYLAGIKSKGAA